MKRILLILLISAMMMAMPFVAAVAADAAFATDAVPALLPQIGSVSGTITEIGDFYDQDNKVVEDKKLVLIAHGGDDISCFVVDADTYFITGDGLSKLQIGNAFTGFYDATLPMIMIDPPQFQSIAVGVNPPVSMYTIKVDKFDDDLRSSDNQLKLILSEQTEILTRHGNEYDGPLSGLTLAVIYDASTGSGPAQAIPNQIIVLEGFLPTKGDILVMDTLIRTNDFYILHRGGKQIVMVPFRAIAEELGYIVTFMGDTVSLGPYYSFKILQDNYTFARREPIALGTAPYFLDGVTYVPLSYFKQVLQLNNAYYFEGKIVIDNHEEK